MTFEQFVGCLCLDRLTIQQRKHTPPAPTTIITTAISRVPVITLDRLPCARLPRRESLPKQLAQTVTTIPTAKPPPRVHPRIPSQVLVLLLLQQPLRIRLSMKDTTAITIWMMTLHPIMKHKSLPLILTTALLQSLLQLFLWITHAIHINASSDISNFINNSSNRCFKQETVLTLVSQLFPISPLPPLWFLRSMISSNRTLLPLYSHGKKKTSPRSCLPRYSSSRCPRSRSVLVPPCHSYRCSSYNSNSSSNAKQLLCMSKLHSLCLR